MATISIFYGSEFGGAQRLAATLRDKINQTPHSAKLIENPQVADVVGAEQLLIVTSTTGQGDIPQNLAPLIYQLQSDFTLLTNKPFGVIAMGDSSYSDTFCGAGQKVEELLLELQGTVLLPRLEIDAIEHYDPTPAALPWLEQYLQATLG